MPDGFVIVSREEGTGTVNGIWNGSALQPDLQEAAFITERDTARALFGSIQSQYSDREISLERATQGITLADPGITIAPPPPPAPPAPTVPPAGTTTATPAA